MVDIRGATIAFDRSGDGPCFVWGHGLTSSRASEDALPMIDWAEVRRDTDLVRYDTRGHGESALVGELASYGWDQLAIDQLALWDHLGIDRAVVGGASMGAATALHVAVLAPERVAALVLVVPPTAWETRAGQVDLYRQMADVVEAAGPEPLIEAGAETPSPDPFVPGPGSRTAGSSAEPPPCGPQSRHGSLGCSEGRQWPTSRLQRESPGSRVPR